MSWLSCLLCDCYKYIKYNCFVLCIIHIKQLFLVKQEYLWNMRQYRHLWNCALLCHLDYILMVCIMLRISRHLTCIQLHSATKPPFVIASMTLLLGILSELVVYIILHVVLCYKWIYDQCVILSYFHYFCCQFNINLVLDPVLVQLNHSQFLIPILILSSYLHLCPLKSLCPSRVTSKIFYAFLFPSVYIVCLPCRIVTDF